MSTCDNSVPVTFFLPPGDDLKLSFGSYVLLPIAQLCATLCHPPDCSPPASSVRGILQREHWSGLPFPAPGDLPDPGIESQAKHGGLCVSSFILLVCIISKTYQTLIFLEIKKNHPVEVWLHPTQGSSAEPHLLGEARLSSGSAAEQV